MSNIKKIFKRVEIDLICKLVLSILVLVIGIMVMIFKTFGLLDLNLYISLLFFTYAFLSTIMYFIRRKEGDYELLILSLINVLVATFMFVFQNSNVPMVLGAGMTTYTILVIANRGYKILILKRKNDYIWLIKFLATVLIGFLGILTSFNLYNEVTVQTMMFGFYFITLGIILTIESVIELFLTDDRLKKILSKILDEEPVRELESVNEVVKKKSTPKKKVEVKEEKKKEVKKQNIKPKNEETTKNKIDNKTKKKTNKSKTVK